MHIHMDIQEAEDNGLLFWACLQKAKASSSALSASKCVQHDAGRTMQCWKRWPQKHKASLLPHQGMGYLRSPEVMMYLFQQEDKVLL